jgi:predicted transcriptional regulator
MPATLVRISQKTSQTLAEIARETNSSVQRVLNEAIEQHRRHCVLSRANAAYAKLRRNSKAWKAYRKELVRLESTMGDGL